MSLQKTKVFNKEDSLAKEQEQVIAKNIAASLKKVVQQPPSDEVVVDQPLEEGAENNSQDLEESRLEEVKASQEEEKALQQSEILAALQQNQEDLMGLNDQGPRKQKKFKQFEQGNITSILDQEIKFPQQTLRYGDILTINFEQQVQKDDEGKLYSGILYSNGVTKLNCDIMPKRLEDQSEAFCNFKCCLFKLESCSSYAVNQKMEVLKQRRTQLEEMNDSSSKQQEGNDHKMDEEQQKERLKAFNKQITKLQDELDNENKDNEYLNDHMNGQKVLYGDLVVLRHIESGMYLSLNQNEAAEENGCVACKLMTLGEDSMLSIVPQDVLRQKGQIISFQDTFHIQNYIEPAANKQAKYLHTSIYKLEKKTDFEKVTRRVLEVNGSSDTTSYKAKLYQPYNYLHNSTEESYENIFSGDVIQFYHKQTGGFLSVLLGDDSEELDDNRRLDQETSEFEALEKILISEIKSKENAEKTDDSQKDNKKGKAKKQHQKEEDEKEEVIETKVQIEIDALQDNKANYLWEVQKLKPFVTSQLNQGDYYRIKHVQSGLYLCLVEKTTEAEEVTKSQNISKFKQDPGKSQFAKGKNDDLKKISNQKNQEKSKSYKLTVKPLDDKVEYLFQIIKDKKTDDSESTNKQNEPIKNLNLILIQSIKQGKIQSIGKKPEEILEDTEVKTSIFKTADQVKQLTTEEVRCQEDAKESQSRMIFTIQKAQKGHADLARIALNQSKSACNYFNFINKFAEVDPGKIERDNMNEDEKEEQKEGENSFMSKQTLEKQINNATGKEIAQLMKKQLTTEYHAKTAKAKEPKLAKVTEQFKKNIFNLKQILKNLSEQNPEEYRLLQNYLHDQGVLDTYVQLLELIMLKTTPHDQRYQISRSKRYFEQYKNYKSTFDQKFQDSLTPYQKFLEEEADKNVKDQKNEQNQLKQTQQNNSSTVQKNQNQKGKSKNDSAYAIVKQIIKQIPGEILTILLLMIKGNKDVDKSLDNYPSILFQQLLGEHIKKAERIFKVSYGLSRLGNIQGDYQSCLESSNRQVQTLQSIGRWIDLIFDPFYTDDKNQNLRQQIIYFKVISLLCQDQKGDGVYVNQMLVFLKLFEETRRLRKMYFGIYNQQPFTPYIQFQLRGNSEDELSKYILDLIIHLENDLELFFKQNPQLKLLIEKKDEKSNEFKKSKKTPPIKLLSIFDSNLTNNNNDYSPYADYLCAYLDIIISCIQNGHKKAKFYPFSIGLDAVFVLSVIDQTSSYKLKIILIKLLTHLFISNDASYGEYGIKNRCYLKSESRNLRKRKIEKSLTKRKKVNISPQLIFSELKKREKEYWNVQKKKVYKIMPQMVEKVLLVDNYWKQEQIDQLDSQEQINEMKEIEQNPKRRLNLIIAALQCSLELIDCEKTTPILNYKIIYASAIVFSWFKNRKQMSKNQKQADALQDDDQKENFFKNFRLFRLFAKARLQPQCKELVDKAYQLLLYNLIAICKKRTDNQILISLKVFRNQQEPTNITQKIVESFQKKINKQLPKGQTVDLKQRSKVQFFKQLTELYSLQAAGQLALSTNFVNSIKSKKLKQACLDLNEFYSPAQNTEYLQYNLKEMLLFLIFDKKLKSDIKNSAFEVLMLNFEMVNSLKTEISRVYIMTADQETEYSKLQQKRYQIVSYTQDILWDSYRIELFNKTYEYKEINEALQDSYKTITQLVNIIKELIVDLQESDKKLQQKQQMLRFLDMPKLLIDCIMKCIRFNDRIHMSLFREIMNFLYLYSQKNEENSKSLIQQLDYLSSLQSIQISNEKLITQIVKQLKSQEKETQLIDHVVKQINVIDVDKDAEALKRINGLRYVCALLKSLNLLSQNSVFNKGNIFNKVLKLDRFYEYLLFINSKAKARHIKIISKDKNQGGNEDTHKIQEICSKYKQLILKTNEEKIRYDQLGESLIKSKKWEEVALARFQYMAHRRMLSLLIQCSQDQANAIPQIAKIVPRASLINILKQTTTPYLLRKKYLRLLLQIHFSQFEEHLGQGFFKDNRELEKFFIQVIYEDIQDCSFAIQFSLNRTLLKFLEDQKMNQAQLIMAKYLLINKNQFRPSEVEKLAREQKVQYSALAKFSKLQSIPQDVLNIAVQEKLKELQSSQNNDFHSNQLLQSLQQYKLKFQGQSNNDDKQAIPQQDDTVNRSETTSLIPEDLASFITHDDKVKITAEEKNIREVQKRIDEQIKQMNEEKSKKASQKNDRPFYQEKYNPIQLKYLDQEEQNEYWKYLSFQSGSMSYKDGLLHFIKDFFANVKWDFQSEDIEKFKDFVLIPLSKLKDTCKYVLQKVQNLIPNADELLLRIDETIETINDTISRTEDKLRYNVKDKQMDTQVYDNQPQSVQIKQALNHTQTYKAAQKLDDTKLKSKVEFKKSILKNSTPNGEKINKLGEKVVRHMLDKTLDEEYHTQFATATDFNANTKNLKTIAYSPIGKPQGLSLVSGKDSEKLKQLYSKKLKESQMQNSYYQRDEADSIFKQYYQNFCDALLRQNISLGALFELPLKDYDQNHTITRKQFIQKVKETSQQLEDKNNKNDSYRFFLRAIQIQNQKKQEDNDKQDEQQAQGSEDEELILGYFGDQLKSYSEEAFQGREKFRLQSLIEQGYIVGQSVQQNIIKKFKEFLTVFSTSQDLQSEKDLNEIIDVIIETFKKQTKQEDFMNFFENMIAGLQVENQRFYILKLLKGILDKYQEDSKHVGNKTLKMMKADIKKFQTIILIMKECKLSENLIKYLDSKQKEEVSQLSIQILILLLEGLNQRMQDQLFEFIKSQQNELKMAEYLKNRIELLTPLVIHQKFEQVRDFGYAHMQQIESDSKESKQDKNGFFRKSKPQQSLILTEFEIEEEKHQSLIKLERKRSDAIKKLTSILRFIQLLCDNCHKGFQNYFRDQLTIQQSIVAQSLYQTQIIEENIENTSSFNIVVTVAKCFMRITENLKELIFFDKVIILKSENEAKDDEARQEKQYGLSSLVQGFFDVIIDFLYGPCEENQILLSGWKKFLSTVNFFMLSDDVYFFAQNQVQEQRFELMFKATLLLLGIIENPDQKKSKEILANISQGISLQNIQKGMISIHRQKILAIPKSYEIFKTRRKFQESAVQSNSKAKLYPQDSLRESDETIFEIGFNFFKFLYIAKRLDPQIPQLQNEPLSEKYIDALEDRSEQLINKEKKSSVQRFYKEKLLEAYLTFQFYKNQIIQLQNQNDERITRDPPKLFRVYRFFNLRNETIRSIEDQVEEISSKKQLNKLLIQGQNKQKSFKSISSSQETGFGLFQSKNQSQSAQKSQKSLDFLDKPDEATVHSIKKLIGILESLDFEENQLPQNKSKEFDDSQDDQNQDSGQQQKLNYFEQFQLQKAMQFYSEFVAEVEVDYNGTLMRSIFKIPQKCAYLSVKSRQNILYGQYTNSLYDKLEGIFSQMNILIAEMKSNQRLARKSSWRYWISNSNHYFQTFSTSLIILINLIYLIFYKTDSHTMNKVFSQKYVDIVVYALSIAQAAISFFIHLGYIEKYHGSYNQRHIDSQKVEVNEKFTEFKGSLGYAEGTIVKSSVRNIIETEMQNIREQFYKSKRQKKKATAYFKDIMYAVRIYFIGLTQDSIHTFNLLYLCFSIGAIFYPFLFSILLLENILQIPLLFNVIQAIVNNRKQILLTLLLLLVIVYVYSFIAFIAFHDTYISADADHQPSLNSYCETLGLCFTSTLNNGVRSGGGIGDVLLQLSDDDNLYWGRYVFDLTFYVMIIVLLLNLIFGIIIDAFAAMRDQRNEIEREVQEKCFICGKPSTIFESKKKSFQDHIQREHNAYAYIYYIFYLSRKPMAECTGVERYVQNMIIQEDPNFFPIDRALGLEEDQDDGKIQELTAE